MTGGGSGRKKKENTGKLKELIEIRKKSIENKKSDLVCYKYPGYNETRTKNIHKKRSYYNVMHD